MAIVKFMVADVLVRLGADFRPCVIAGQCVATYTGGAQEQQGFQKQHDRFDLELHDWAKGMAPRQGDNLTLQPAPCPMLPAVSVESPLLNTHLTQGAGQAFPAFCVIAGRLPGSAL